MVDGLLGMNIGEIMKYLIISFIIFFSGCTGLVTGHKYDVDDAVIAYKVVRSGTTTFMTVEQIENYHLDDLDDVSTKSYRILKGND